MQSGAGTARSLVYLHALSDATSSLRSMTRTLNRRLSRWNVPQGFPKPTAPANNRMSAATVELGQYLFYDQRMSVNGKESCARCHWQELAFTDGRARATGTTGQGHPRNSMRLVNVAYAPVLAWPNPRLESLEEQALGPMLSVEPIRRHDNFHAVALRLLPLGCRLIGNPQFGEARRTDFLPERARRMFLVPWRVELHFHPV
jgi:cytochrome c peroxidase